MYGFDSGFLGRTAEYRQVSIEPCIANELRASNGSPDSQAAAGIAGSLAMQTSISARFGVVYTKGG